MPPAVTSNTGTNDTHTPHKCIAALICRKSESIRVANGRISFPQVGTLCTLRMLFATRTCTSCVQGESCDRPNLRGGGLSYVSPERRGPGHSIRTRTQDIAASAIRVKNFLRLILHIRHIANLPRTVIRRLYLWIDALIPLFMAMFYYYLPALLSLATALNPTSQTAQTHPQQQQQVSQNEWDRIDVNKMDKELTSWLKRGPDVPYPIQPIRPPQTIQPNPPTPYPDPQPGPTVLPEGCLAPRGQFASWSSCSSYLNCWDGIVIEQECPGGLLFNEYKGYCDFSDNVYCGSRPVATPQPELQPGSNVCPTPNGQYRSSTNCSEFYVCVYGKPIMRHCPRGLVYNEVFGICDYLYRVDCRGAAEPAPWSPPIIPHPPHHPYPPTPPPSYYPPQPQYPSTYPPQHHPVNPWLSKGSIAEPDLWNQSPVASSWEKQQEKDKEIEQQHQLHLQQGADIEHSLQQQEAEKPLQTKPWDQTRLVLTQLEEKRCTDGEVHRLNDSCSSVVVCRNGHLLRIECPSGLTYDKPSDSCKPSTIAKWSV